MIDYYEVSTSYKGLRIDATLSYEHAVSPGYDHGGIPGSTDIENTEFSIEDPAELLAHMRNSRCMASCLILSTISKYVALGDTVHANHMLELPDILQHMVIEWAASEWSDQIEDALLDCEV